MGGKIMEVEITRKQIVTIESVNENSYHDLLFTAGGKEYKISTKRRQYFDNVIQVGAEVKLNYAMSSFGKEYVFSAEQTGKHEVNKLIEAAKKMGVVPVDEIRKDGFKPQQPSGALQSTPTPIKPQSNTMTLIDWEIKDTRTRKSIERQKALEIAMEIGKSLLDAEIEVAKINQKTTSTSFTAEKVITTAKRFEKYLELGE